MQLLKRRQREKVTEKQEDELPITTVLISKVDKENNETEAS
jgi:hypothetical protein